MPSDLDERHVLPPDESQRAIYQAIYDAMAPIQEAMAPVAALMRDHAEAVRLAQQRQPFRQSQPRLVGPDGTTVDLPGDVYNLLRQIVKDLNEGHAVIVQTTDPVLTTGQAADILGVSRVTLVKLLDEDVIPSFKRGRHRRVHLADLMAYDQETARRRRETLDEMTREAAEKGLDDALDFVPIRED